MATATFTIGGMHCASCAFRNERTLRKVPGVLEANVDLGTRRALIKFDEGRLRETALHQAIRANGYEVVQHDVKAECGTEEWGEGGGVTTNLRFSVSMPLSTARTIRHTRPASSWHSTYER